MPAITLPDGSQRQYPNPVTVAQIAADIGPGLARAALAGRVDDRLVDTSFTVASDARARYESALRLAPRSAPAFAGLAELYRQQGDLQAALEAAGRAARYQSHDWRYREQLARLEASAGQPAAAVVQARAAARFAPPWETARLRAFVSELRATH